MRRRTCPCTENGCGGFADNGFVVRDINASSGFSTEELFSVRPPCKGLS